MQYFSFRSDSYFLSQHNKNILDYSDVSNKTMIYGNILQDILGSLDLLFDQKLLISSILWNRTSKDENDIEALMLTQDKNLRCIAILTSKITIASLGNYPYYPEKIIEMLPLKRLNLIIKKILVPSVSWEIPFYSKVPVLIVQCCYISLSVLYEYVEYIVIKFNYSDG